MPFNTFSFGRPITSYAKVQSWVSTLVRNKQFQLKRGHLRDLEYLDVGCGPNSHDEFVNLDFDWQPGVDVCWDISKGLPFTDSSMKGVYSEHCLEHFSLARAKFLISEFRRVLKRTGVLRLIVPDAELYLRTYVDRLSGESEAKFPFEVEESQRDESWTPILSVNRVFYQDRESSFGHCTMFDYELLRAILLKSGFTEVRKVSFRVGANKKLLIDSPLRRLESLYVEAT